MSSAAEPGRSSRRAELAGMRLSRRPSRLGTRAGAAPGPDRVLPDEAGFPGLLARVVDAASAAPTLHAAVRVLLTLDGHVPADVQLRALRIEDEAALAVLGGVSWREGDRPAASPLAPGDRPAFVGELGLTSAGRVVARVPSGAPLDVEEDLAGAALRVPWSSAALLDYGRRGRRARERASRAAADCRRWLADAGAPGRDDLVEQLQEAALRTAPFVFYQGSRMYTNFRDRNTLTGKTLWPGHPDCALSVLLGLPLELWSDADAVMVVCLTLLIRSAGFARIEEANGTQLSVDHVAYLLERTRREYNRVPGGRPVPPALTTRVEELDGLAEALRTRRRHVGERVQLYREIHSALMHKTERTAGRLGAVARRRHDALRARLRGRLPVADGAPDDLESCLAEAPEWLARPHDGFGTGLEALVHAAVTEAADVADADFAMSRGMRSLPALVRALRARDYAEITRWGIAEYFCCVVPSPGAHELFDGSTARLADVAWAISARMQYNSWHFIAGNLPGVPAVRARDYFVPPTIPDLAYHSDLHHRGHVASRVRYSIRSPQPVRVLDTTFDGFVDLRLMRCSGPPFDEQDLLLAQRVSACVATATSLAAALVADGTAVEVTAFDPQWHWKTITGAKPPTAPPDGEGR
ncbi:hypothetical protein GCM10022254_03850 [Actinomadura meridiana]|uniref:Uncharacterized protein n=1 Tax=Actinomadura meridiana TaxID=559626 RepID=A0ABP8BSD7_9ACTN